MVRKRSVTILVVAAWVALLAIVAPSACAPQGSSSSGASSSTAQGLTALPGVVFLQRIADGTGVLAPQERALALPPGWTIVDEPLGSLSGTAGGSGQVTGYSQLVAPDAGAGAQVSFGGDVEAVDGGQQVIGIQGRPVSDAGPAVGQVLEYTDAGTWAPGTVSSAAPARPASDANTLLDFRFNETVPGVLINYGSYGTGVAGSLGPAPTTVSSTFTLPGSAGSSVSIPATSNTGYLAGQLIRLGPRLAGGAGGTYLYVTGTSSGSISAVFLGSTGSLAGSSTVVAGTTIQASLDLIYQSGSGYPTMMCSGLYDYTQYFGDLAYLTPGWCNAESSGALAGGSPDFVGITRSSIHVLVRRSQGAPWYNNPVNNQDSQLFGYSTTRNWNNPFGQLGASINANSMTGTWSAFGGNQSWSLVGNGVPAYGNIDDLEWNLLSITMDLTVTTNAFNYYKNGQLVASQNISSTGSMAFGSGGYWYVGNPFYNLGDTGDRTYAFLQLARYENVVRSAAYIQSMYRTINPKAASWPVP